MILYHPDNPFRPVDWRWSRAIAFAEGRMRGLSRKKEDEWVMGALRFRRALDRCHDDIDRYTLMEQNPPLYFAWQAHRPPGEEQAIRGTPLRYSLEARLLAGESVESIAAKLGCSTKVVEWYERVFFNVSDRLANPDYIMTVVIGPTVHTGLGANEYDVLWKVFGYLYGPLVLDAFIFGTSDRRHAQSLEDVDTKLAGDVQDTVRRKAAVAARSYALNNFTQEGLMNIYARFLELNKAADAGAAKDTFLSTVNLVLNAMPFADGAGTIRPGQTPGEVKLLRMEQPGLEHYDGVSAELRTDELLAITSGKELQARADLENMKFPEPPNASDKATH